MADEKKTPEAETKEEVKEIKDTSKKEEAKDKETKIEDTSKEVKEEKTDETQVDSKEALKEGSSASSEQQAEIPELKPGMTVKVYQKIKELNIKGEEKERIQFFEGMIIAKKHGKETGGTITVRKVSNGVGVEKIFPLNLPTIEKIEVKKIAKVRRSKLFFLRRGYKKRLRETVVTK